MIRQLQSAFVIALAAPLALACTKKVTIDPRNVVSMSVHPAGGGKNYCPGAPFQVELSAQMNDGTVCSNVNKRSGCLGHSKAIIDPKDVRLQATNSQLIPRPEYSVMPDPNPLTTAATGMKLKGWLEVTIEEKQMKTGTAKATLTPVYSCMQSNLVMPVDAIDAGANGVRGPDVDVYATPMATPYYPDAVLVRIEAPSIGFVRYVISPSADQPVTIASKGQAGGRGFSGEPGRTGAHGASSSNVCGSGGPGGPGGNGGPGGDGGNGGPGGSVRVYLDASVAPALRSRLTVSSQGGDAGGGGSGGAGGYGGSGGSGGPSAEGCSGRTGSQGPSGIAGSNGRPGLPGRDGPPPRFFSGPRTTLFAKEASQLSAIENPPQK